MDRWLTWFTLALTTLVSVETYHWWNQGGTKGARPPPGPNSFIFMEFSAKSRRPHENHGAATAHWAPTGPEIGRKENAHSISDTLTVHTLSKEAWSSMRRGLIGRFIWVAELSFIVDYNRFVTRDMIGWTISHRLSWFVPWSLRWRTLHNIVLIWVNSTTKWRHDF